MEINEKLVRILSAGNVCDHCLGRQFSSLLSGLSNNERGSMLRKAFAMRMDALGKTFDTDFSNFSGFCFRNPRISFKRDSGSKNCWVCNGFFSEIESLAERISKKLSEYDFRTFLVGTVLSDRLLSNEERLWEAAGLDYCEPIKSEINRETGKIVEKITGACADLAKPDMTIIIDTGTKSFTIKPNPLFIYGEYSKFSREIPQTKWPSGKYRTSVEQIVAAPFMKAARGIGHKFHGMGREDIDARCLAKRPFVLEITSPVKRFVDLEKMARHVNRDKRVRVSGLRFSDSEEVIRIKQSCWDKEYSVIVECDMEISKKELSMLGKKLKKTIQQQTPSRVLHRRADRQRARKVRTASASMINRKKFRLNVRGESGLYIKELVSGDSGRTKPSVSGILGCKCVPKELDVIKIFQNKKN